MKTLKLISRKIDNLMDRVSCKILSFLFYYRSVLMTRTFSSDVFQFFKLIDDPVTIYGKEHKDKLFLQVMFVTRYLASCLIVIRVSK